MRGSILTERSTPSFSPRGHASRAATLVKSEAPGACALCGSTSVEVDEVGAPERLALHECRRCDHRWTHAVQPAQPRAALRRVRRAAAAGPVDPAEVAPARKIAS